MSQNEDCTHAECLQSIRINKYSRTDQQECARVRNAVFIIQNESDLHNSSILFNIKR